MSELTLNQIERIDRLQLSRHRKRELSGVQKLDRAIVLFAFGIALLILATVFLINAEWQPGRQQEITAEYKAMRHSAVAVGDWK